MEDSKAKELIEKYKSTIPPSTAANLEHSKLEQYFRLDLNEDGLTDFLMNFYTEKGHPMIYPQYYEALKAIKTIYSWTGNPAADNLDPDKCYQDYYINYNRLHGLDQIIEILDQVISENFNDIKLRNYYKLLIRLMSSGMLTDEIVKIEESGIDSAAYTVSVDKVSYYLDLETMDLLRKVMKYMNQEDKSMVYGNPGGYDFPIYMTQKLYRKINCEIDRNRQIGKMKSTVDRYLKQLNDCYKYFSIRTQLLKRAKMYQELIDMVGLDNARYIANPRSYRHVSTPVNQALLNLAKKYNIQTVNAKQIREQLEFVCW